MLPVKNSAPCAPLLTLSRVVVLAICEGYVIKNPILIQVLSFVPCSAVSDVAFCKKSAVGLEWFCEILAFVIGSKSSSYCRFIPLVASNVYSLDRLISEIIGYRSLQLSVY